MLRIIDLRKSYNNQPLLKGINLTLEKGEVICLLGASGSGKSTMLRIVAGLEEPERGRIEWNGNDMAKIPTHRRHFSLMFQDYALFPHLSVRGNIEYGMRRLKWDSETIRAEVQRLAAMTGVTNLLERGISDLSGGEQQRVALARALAVKPALLMLDEPLGALDRKLKGSLLEQLRDILKNSALPALYVTHDQEEAFAIADRIILLNEGAIVQDGTPRQIYEHPASAWVAEFMGLGSVVTAKRLVDGWQTKLGIFPESAINTSFDEVDLLIRPPAKLDPNGPIASTVKDVIFHGDSFKVELENGHKIELAEMVRVGQAIRVSPNNMTVIQRS